MAIFRSDPKKELAVIEEDDEFYEDIEAPKFVDFTVPDRSRPDDKSWFCLRIGCDQQHEEVDPDALYRSFMLRVMSARSPNIRFQKALNRRIPRSTEKCPRSAPAKSAKDRVSRLSTITSIPDKMAKSKLKNHPVANLRSTPTNTKEKLQSLASEKKALTTPRTKKCPSNHEPFRSAKHQKAPVAVPKNRSVAKALFLGTSKEDDEVSKILNSEICDGMKKLNISNLKKHTPGERICKASRNTACDPNCSQVSGKKGEEVSFKKRNESQEAEISSTSSDHSVVKTNVEEMLPTSSVLIAKQTQQSTMTDSASSNNSDEEDSKENMAVFQASSEPDTQAGVMDNVAEFDDKENDSSTRNVNSSITNSENERLQSESRENIPQKEIRTEIRAPSKKIQERTQAGKLKRTTNPKPFRLRTDERGILKEANWEKKKHLEAQKETGASLKRGDEKQQNASHDKNRQTTSEEEQRPKQARIPRVRFVESRYARGIPKCHKIENKKTEESQKKIAKTTASSRQILKAQSVTTARKAQVSQFRDKGALDTRTQIEHSKMTNTTCLKGDRPSIPKASTFQRLHVPKNCSVRPNMTTP